MFPHCLPLETRGEGQVSEGRGAQGGRQLSWNLAGDAVPLMDPSSGSAG